ncbi:chromosome partitioning protein ParB [Kosakonia sacchari]|uniref:chromosome partitioning protein ParB n=1 Tax=Kosakonia sacchari TaxID=1158459 RepID=UPI0013626E52|nr:chromosome partitioning protein ParB [Kosakonia sacchari]QHM95308.1 chromosome partitioning protein ParB [Kosakonia sacchari]
MIKGRLISSQRYLNRAVVAERALKFKRFVVNVFPVVLRDTQYTILMDGHHNFAAAKLAGVDPDFRPVSKKLMKILKGMSAHQVEALLINNVTDSDYYFVDSGEVVDALVLPDTGHRFQVHAGNQWVLGGSS